MIRKPAAVPEMKSKQCEVCGCVVPVNCWDAHVAGRDCVAVACASFLFNDAQAFGTDVVRWESLC